MQISSKKNWLYGLLLILLAILTLSNLLGLTYFYHLYQYQSLMTQHQIEKNQTAIQNIEHQSHQKQPDLNKIAHLYQIESLLHQAQFQINQLSDIQIAKKYLRFAEEIAETKHLTPLEETIKADIQMLHQIHLSNPTKLTITLNQLQVELENLHDTTGVEQAKPNTNKASPAWAKKLHPLLQIDRYQVSSGLVYAPTEQSKMIEQALTWITPIQMAAFHHQQKRYQLLLTHLAKSLERLPQNENIQQILRVLMNQQFKIKKAVNLQSYQQIHQLIQNESLT